MREPAAESGFSARRRPANDGEKGPLRTGVRCAIIELIAHLYSSHVMPVKTIVNRSSRISTRMGDLDWSSSRHSVGLRVRSRSMARVEVLITGERRKSSAPVWEYYTLESAVCRRLADFQKQ